ncbi:hypothetical protein [Sphingorhabdus sp.]|uniref:hypothetical protein n=1 Tax=Sphingorhabdus sp. TaxID=1902408 RepID=UPI00391BE5A9
MTDFQTAQPGPRGRMRLKHIMLLLLLAFAGGGVATWWLASQYGVLTGTTAVDASQPDRGDTRSATGNVAPVLPPSAGTTPQVSDQVVPVYVADSAISGDAVRGEGLLLTYAVRRTLENGAPLGYLAEQLRLRFGATQPQAVATVISAAQAPVTIDNLQTELSGLAPVLLSGDRDSSFWATVNRELSQLFVLRRDGGAAMAPAQRLVRAQALVEAGNVAAAMEEVAAMPGASAAQSWMVRARRFSDARKALDRLDQMALIRPVVVPVTVPAPVQSPAPEGAETAS